MPHCSRERILSRTLIGFLLCALPALVQAQSRGGASVERREGEIKATGLSPVFPRGMACTEIASGFGSKERVDGSVRRDDRFSGQHGGMDLSLTEGTPLLAVAAGRVIAKGEGGNLEGIYLWLQHAPADTGLGYWAYTKYQHLSRLPALNEGDAVGAGQTVGLSGMTGTIGRAFGPKGYSHLHLTLFLGPSNQFEKAGEYNSMVRAGGARIADPLLLYAPDLDIAAIDLLAEDRKRVLVGAIGADGAVHPAGSKVVWPVRCAAGGA